MGQDTEAILKKFLGYSEEKIRELEEKGLIVTQKEEKELVGV